MEAYSVLMSVYRKENPSYLEKSIESMLKQTAEPSDFVLVCDGPLTEELDAVVEKVKEERPDLFQIIRLPQCGGLGNALNTGIKYCRYDLIARMDSDDISLPDRCQKQLKCLEDSKTDMVSGTLLEFEGDISRIRSRRVLPETSGEIRRFARRRNPFNHPCIMYRKKAVEDAGGYRHCPWFEDYDLWTRMLMNGSEGYNLQEPLLYMRAGDGMYSRRGGLEYAKKAVVFRYRLMRKGFSRPTDFIISAAGQICVSLMPNQLRKKFYKKAPRK